MVVFISGKITGDPDYREKFEQAADRLWRAGYTPLHSAGLPAGLSEAAYMDISLAMLRAADGILALPDWQESQGARIEMGLAVKSDKTLLMEVEYGRFELL